MHSVIALDADNRLLSNSITWGDIRASVWAERIKHEHDGNAIYRRTGTPIHPMSPLCKLMWMRHEKPEVFNKAARFVGIKEYLLYQLFGQWVVDHSIASATGMFNLRELAWDQGALELLGVTPEQLPTPVPTTHRLPALRRRWRSVWGCRWTPFIIGANDGVLSNLGVNAIEIGHVAVTIGTSGAMRTVIDEPLTDPHGRLFCYALTEKHWVVGGPVNNGGNIFRWVRDELATAEAAAAREEGVDPYEALTRIAEKVRPGAEGLAVPSLHGRRARAAVECRPARLLLRPGPASRQAPHDPRRAGGVIFNLYSILPALEELVGPTKRMMATGGFARSALWRQMMADIFNREVVVPESVESSCLGAAVLGAWALGLLPSLSVISGMVGSTNHHAPEAEAVAVYGRLQPIFAAIPAKLEAEYHAIAAFQRETGKRTESCFAPSRARQVLTLKSDKKKETS
jgi:gluconokinase